MINNNTKWAVGGQEHCSIGSRGLRSIVWDEQLDDAWIDRATLDIEQMKLDRMLDRKSKLVIIARPMES